MVLRVVRGRLESLRCSTSPDISSVVRRTIHKQFSLSSGSRPRRTGRAVCNFPLTPRQGSNAITIFRRSTRPDRHRRWTRRQTLVHRSKDVLVRIATGQVEYYATRPAATPQHHPHSPHAGCPILPPPYQG